MVKHPAMSFLEIQCWLIGHYPLLAVEKSNSVQKIDVNLLLVFVGRIENNFCSKNLAKLAGH